MAAMANVEVGGADSVTVEEMEVSTCFKAGGADDVTAEEMELLAAAGPGGVGPAVGSGGVDAETAAEAVREQAVVVADVQAWAPHSQRPPIDVTTAVPCHPPHLGDDHGASVAVPADGLCLYYCAVACQDLTAWANTHHPITGLGSDLLQRAADLTEAWTWRDRVVSRARELGDVRMAARLSLEGAPGYPDQDALPYLAHALGGQVVLQTSSLQTAYGQGPLVAHINFCVAVDGEGHGSGHFEVLQSWVHCPRAVKRAREGDSEESGMGLRTPPQPFPPPPQATSALPPSDAAREPSCAAFLDALGVAAGGFEARPHERDEVVDTDDIVKYTEALRKKVLAMMPLACPAVVKVAVVLLMTHRLRLLDMSMLQHVGIIYAIEGGECMRAHNGTLYLYSNGGWLPFSGVFPVSTMSRVRRVLLRAEGALRLFGNAPRTEDGVLRAIDGTLRNSPNEESWILKVENAVLDVRDDDEDETPSWPRALASAISRCSASLQGLLSGKRCVPFLIEWCDTPLEKTAGFATNDSCYVFDDGDVIMKKVKKSPSQNIYMFIPRNMHDAVLAGDVSRLSSFLKTTFFDNGAALQCHFAAFALALRGYNVDRAFWTLGGGGVGQSLLSHLVANVFGDNHAFIDMNIYFTDDEMRKQGDLLAGRAVVTGQEMPNETKEMREDIYKKHISADAVSCRLPYAVLTKQVQLTGLKRFEMNQTPRFRAATEANFNSVERRSLVVELRGQFVTEGEIQAAFPQGGNEAEGIFVKDPTLKDFLTSSGAVAAFLRLLEGFLKTRSQATCRALIEDYAVMGGDRGLTRQVMRLACGLSPDAPVQAKRTLDRRSETNAAEVVTVDSVAAEAPRTPAGAAPRTPGMGHAAPRTPGTALAGRASFVDRERASVRRDHVALVKLCLRERLDMVNKSNIGRLTQGVWAAPNAKERAAVFEKLLAHGFWVELPKRNQMTCPCIPVVETEHLFQSALPHPLKHMPFVGLHELVSVNAVRTFLAEDGRAANDTAMMQFFEQMAKGGPRQGRGKLPKEIALEAKEWAERSEKMQKHVHALTLLRGWLRDQGARNATTVQSSQVDVEQLTTDYACAIDAWGRAYGGGLCFQGLSRRVRGAIRGTELHDWDISNCMFSLTVQLARRLGLKLQVPEADLPTWTKYAEDPDAVRSAIAGAGVLGFDAKAILIKVAHGGSVPETGNHAVDELLAGISREARLLRWLACSLLPDVHKAVLQNPKKYSWPEASVFHYMWATVENQCLVSFVRFAQMQPLRHLSLHFDGLLVDAARADASEDFAAAAQATILADTGYSVHIVRKLDRTFLESLRHGLQGIGDSPLPAADAAVLLQRGRSVPLALAHATGEYSRFAAAIRADAASRRDAYGDWSSVVLGMDRQHMRHLLPEFGLHVPADGPCLLHAHGTGRPECAAIVGQPDGVVRVFDGQRVGTMRLADVHRAWLAASDRKTVVTFAFGADKADAARGLLLALRAP